MPVCMYWYIYNIYIYIYTLGRLQLICLQASKALQHFLRSVSCHVLFPGESCQGQMQKGYDSKGYGGGGGWGKPGEGA